MSLAMTQAPSKPEKLFTFKSGGWVLLLAGFFTLVAAALVLYPVLSTGGFHPMVGDGRNVDSYQFDLSNLTIPKETLVASGNPKDQIRSIPEKLAETITPKEVDLIAANEHRKFLVPSDRVIGVIIGSEVRAYPLRVLNFHELANDVVGGVPIAVSYSPLSGSVVVFDRRIDGQTAEFGVSGLMANSTTVYFDRQNDPSRESLWPQLALKAVSGPAAGKAITLIPSQITTWGQWRTSHPDTRVLQGLRTHKKDYNSDPYNLYIVTDDLRFAASPLWNSPKALKKTPILAVSPDGKKWKALPANTASAESFQIQSYLFAWYAQHPTDTDFAEFQ